MSARVTGFWLGLAAFAATLIFPEPSGMEPAAWHVAGLVAWMAAWWMTEAVPLPATGLLPFVVQPLIGAGGAKEVAGDYYSPIIFLLLGGSFLALAIERTGLHRRLALAILNAIGGRGGSFGLLLGFMLSAAVLSNIISNTSTALIMMPMALAVLAGGETATADGSPPQSGMSGALPMGIAFAASIGGLGTIIGTPTNAIAVALIEESTGATISFAMWAAFGVPLVLIGTPLAAWIIARVLRVADHPFDNSAARAALADARGWSVAEKRLVWIIAITFLLWMTRPLYAPFLPDDGVTDGSIAVLAVLVLFMLPDGSGRQMLDWKEANRAPWGVILMFGGGLALAAGMTRSGLAGWVGEALLPLGALPIFVVALAVVAIVVLVTEFASNVATASGFMPVVASLAVALGGDPLFLALPAAFAASWGFILPSGTGPNAIAWSTGRLTLPGLFKAGLTLDVAGCFLIVGVVWVVASLL